MGNFCFMLIIFVLSLIFIGGCKQQTVGNLNENSDGDNCPDYTRSTYGSQAEFICSRNNNCTWNNNRCEYVERCVDTDDGNYQVFGDTISYFGIFEPVIRSDFCSGNYSLYEFYCEDGMTNDVYSCPLGCANGACINSVQSDEPEYSSPNENIKSTQFIGLKPSNECKPVLISGDPEESLNIAYVGDDYSASEIEEFANDVQKNAENLFTDPTLNTYKDKINIYRVDSIEDLNCRSTTEECHNSLINSLLISAETETCCDLSAIRDLTSVCPNRHLSLVMVNSEMNMGTAMYWEGFNEFKTSLGWIRGNVLKKERGAIAIVSNSMPGGTMIHEIGHVAGFLPDYYAAYTSYGLSFLQSFSLEDEPLCSLHPCRMCSSSLYFSQESLCYDKQKMVKYLNQWCDARVDIHKGGVYPNPIDLSGVSKVNVKFDVEYEREGDPCYALMEVYDSRGALVDYVVSSEPVGDGQHILQWDGKDLEQRQVASGVYLYQVSIGTGKNNKDSVKGTLIK